MEQAILPRVINSWESLKCARVRAPFPRATLLGKQRNAEATKFLQ